MTDGPSMERRRDAFLGAADYALKARDLVVSRGGPRVPSSIETQPAPALFGF